MKRTYLRLMLFFLIVLLFSQQSDAVELNYLYSFGSSDLDLGLLNMPYHISQTLDGNLIICDKKPSIQVFSPDGNLVTDLNTLLPEGVDSREAVYITLDQDHNYYLAFENDRRVIKYNSTKEYLTQWDDSSISWISSLHLINEERILLADNESLKVLNNDGTIEKQFDELDLWQPAGLAIDSDGLIYIANTNLNNIKVINLEGNLLKEWNEPFIADDEFLFMRQIVIDHNGNLIILASSVVENSTEATLRMYNPSGTFLQQIQITDPTPETADFLPLDFTISNNQLYLVDMLGNSIHVYQIIDAQ